MRSMYLERATHLKFSKGSDTVFVADYLKNYSLITNMESQVTDKAIKRILFIGSGFALGYCIYATYKSWKKRQWKNIDEGFEDVSKIEEAPEKRILVLGLENAGKSSLISQLETGSTNAIKELKPTKGFNVTTRESNGICLKIWELSGTEKFRAYWANFLQDTDVLVFVVDASNVHDLSLAVNETKWLLADERLADVPVILVANKQDIRNALTPEEVADALDLGSVPGSKHKIYVVGTQTPPGAEALHPSILELEKTLLYIIND